ncbi:2-polyprenyl-6-hydroxyphenyl methylase/3-demethylubiquinone-9 3-methyltransferase [Larkinella arboricola]|uniref:2-polyprenyl-6-hydroxyphenyl methylase/3-demethylubiquinone-9 3-methyltransferase n=1 Tax=Larkinella arboricola TaxID=643671 RepID=A0A327WW53_LARAB|nr:class I SAM-dependent methyltransferase [Larkinella arboricola]RAJ95971.1 2-polyprenyl-6-hydroxyphenyl methylase/3-demethylubiquinone-9 3-methyltransferase [Larkinella arboricola]
MGRITSFIKRKVFRMNRDRWNYQYDKGLWEGLKGLDELARFSVIIGYIKYLKPGQPEIVEIGCGEGLLQQRLQTQNYGRYVGLDISDRAIQTAQAQADGKCTYRVGDMDTYQPEGSFDLIIFNESIYYSRHPLETLQRYATRLKANGLLIVTINDHKHSDELWHRIRDGFDLLDEATTITAKSTCVCKVLLPKGAKSEL